MKKWILLVLVVALTSAAMAQKVQVKKGMVTVDGEKFLKADKSIANMSLYQLYGEEELIFIKLVDPTPNIGSNHDSYYVVRFMAFNAEVEFENMTKKAIIKKIYKEGLVQDDQLHEEKLTRFVAKYGTDMSNRRYWY